MRDHLLIVIYYLLNKDSVCSNSIPFSGLIVAARFQGFIFLAALFWCNPLKGGGNGTGTHTISVMRVINLKIIPRGWEG